MSQAGNWRCLPSRPHEGGLALSPRPDTVTTRWWHHQMLPPLAYGRGSCSPDGNPLTRDSRGPFWSELLGTPGENLPTHQRTPEDYIQRALDRQPELPLSRRGNGMRYSRPTQASNGNQREGWKELHIAALRAPHLCLAAPTPPLAPASLHDWRCLL